MPVRLYILAVVLLLLPPALQAVVYDVQHGVRAAEVQKRLGAHTVRRDPVTVNGARGTIEIAWSDLAPNALLDTIGALLKDYPAARGPGQILIEIPGEEGWLTRLYILQAGDRRRSLIFTIHIPRAAQTADAARYWPTSLPPPPNGKPETVIRLGDGGVLWATYTTDTPPAEATRDYSRELLATGPWKPVSEDPTGGFYLDNDGRRLLLLSATQGRDRTLTAIYVRPLTSRDGIR